MSKKKSNKKSDEMLDTALMGNEATQAPTPTKENGEVSLLEYSKNAAYSFNIENYKILFAGLGVNVLGFILMIGGGAGSPAEFDGDALFSTTRITVAPALIVLGYLIIAYAIMKRPKKNKE